MKEIEEKARAYDEAIEKARKIQKYSSDLAEIKRMEKIFPELRESEEEWIRKAIKYAIGQSTHSDGTLINGISSEEALAWFEKQGGKHDTEPVSIIEIDGEKWVRVHALGEDFAIAPHNYVKDDKSMFNWFEACEIGTFNKRQGILIQFLIAEIDEKLKEIGRDTLKDSYWTSTEHSAANAWLLIFNNGNFYTSNKSTYSFRVRPIKVLN